MGAWELGRKCWGLVRKRKTRSFPGAVEMHPRLAGIFAAGAVLLLFLALAFPNASAEVQNLTFSESHFLQPFQAPLTRMHELYSLTEPVRPKSIGPVQHLNHNRACLRAVRDWFALNYTNSAAVCRFSSSNSASESSLMLLNILTILIYLIQMMAYSGNKPGDYGNVRQVLTIFPSHFPDHYMSVTAYIVDDITSQGQSLFISL